MRSGMKTGYRVQGIGYRGFRGWALGDRAVSYTHLDVYKRQDAFTVPHKTEVAATRYPLREMAYMRYSPSAI